MLTLARFPTSCFGEIAARWWTLVMFWRSLRARERSTRYITTRGACSFDRGCRSCLAAKRRRGWRFFRRRHASAKDASIDLLQIKRSEEVREERRVKGGRLGEEEGARARRRRRIWPEMSAGLQGSDE
jgi:hypothetical protein